MVIGETIATGVAGTTLFSPWFEAFGNSATFALECLRFLPGTGMATLTIEVQTKKTEDSDSLATTLDPAPPSAWVVERIGVTARRYVGFTELIRFKYIYASVPPTKDATMHYRMLPPLWESNRLCCDLETTLTKQVEAPI